ncbi:hypothetical protein TELCIR_08732 [Teladorsagia circumcincta]|uniref:Uncharacterized protein n=1 Tax=Teladorsagia circumcincta TaxID=45464 RepID=A0A2G9UGQ9_TELCI|nr:hypothetical protein TELCIR_08732 [Teladorsagia circumcincta]
MDGTVKERIITARSVTEYTRITVVQVYAPTEVVDDEKKMNYENLQETIDALPRRAFKYYLVTPTLNSVMAGKCLERSLYRSHLLIPSVTMERDKLLFVIVINCARTFNTKGYTRRPGDHLMESRSMKSTIFASVTDGDVLFKMFAYSADIGSDHYLMKATVKLKVKQKKKTNDHSNIQCREFKGPSYC